MESYMTSGTGAWKCAISLKSELEYTWLNLFPNFIYVCR